MTAEEVRGLYQVRSALEGLAVKTIISSPQRADAVARLRWELGNLADDKVGFAERLEADLKFHLLLVELAGNPMLVESWRHLEGRIRVSIMSNKADELPEIMSRHQHAPIVDAIARGDVEAALGVVESHMQAAADVYA
jgi:DNA-binding GntR family transcriptional regulator